jgi:hypothetical protein
MKPIVGGIMPASLDRIRESMTVKSTPKDKGLQLTLSLVAYDNGMIQLDGIPINTSPDYDSVDGWLGAVEVAVTTINEFRRQAQARHRRATSDAGPGQGD